MNSHQKDLLRHEGFVRGFVAARDPDTLLTLEEAEHAWLLQIEWPRHLEQKIQILRNYFPCAETPVIEVTHEGEGITLHDAVVVPIDDALRFGWIRITTRDTGSHSFEVVTTTEPAKIDQLCAENAALTEVYAVAACERQFPVPFDDHLALVDAVDKCRLILEPPIDDYDYSAAPRPTGWQAHVAAYPREEFLATFREAHAALHRLWTEAVGKEGYDKAVWKVLDNALARFARDAAEKVGIARTEPLL